MFWTWVLYRLRSGVLFLDDKLPCKKKAPRLNLWTALKVLTVKYCLSYPGAYVKWSGKTDTEEIMYFLCALSNDKWSCLSGEFLSKCWFCKQKESAFQVLFLFIYFFFNNAANQKLYLLDLLDNLKSTYVKKCPSVTLTFCTLLLCRSIIYSKANNSRNILLCMLQLLMRIFQCLLLE